MNTLLDDERIRVPTYLDGQQEKAALCLRIHLLVDSFLRGHVSARAESHYKVRSGSIGRGTQHGYTFTKRSFAVPGAQESVVWGAFYRTRVNLLA